LQKSLKQTAIKLHKSPDETDRAQSWSLLQMRYSYSRLQANKNRTPGDSDYNFTPLLITMLLTSLQLWECTN